MPTDSDFDVVTRSRVPVIGRWAPSPTGDIHLGSAVTALLAWLSVRHQSGRLIWRVEDLDGPRSLAGMNTRHMDDLRWLGLDWDEGPDIGGPSPPYRQSSSHDVYTEALKRLEEHGRLFPCNRSRKQIQQLAPGSSRAYPVELRPIELPQGWLDRLLANESNGQAVRLRVDDGLIEFIDRVHGKRSENVSQSVGDFVLRRRDGIWAYQLAVVVDDGRQGVTEVVRGADLLDSTARQIVLQRALDLPTPSYAHGPVLVDENGVKLSKSHGALSLRSLRERSIPARRIVSALARAIGILERPGGADPKDLIDDFDWSNVRSGPVPITAEWLEAESLQ